MGTTPYPPITLPRLPQYRRGVEEGSFSSGHMATTSTQEVSVAQYSDIVQEHFERPRNIGVIASADAEAVVSNPACGDIMHLSLRIANDRITEAKFKTMGCPAAIAAGSVTTEMLIGRTVEEALQLTRTDVNTALGGLSAQKVHTSVLAEDAVRAALKQYRQR